MSQSTFNLAYFAEWMQFRVPYFESLGFTIVLDHNKDYLGISLINNINRETTGNLQIFSDGACDSFYLVEGEERVAHSSLASLIDFLNLEAEILFMLGLKNETDSLKHRSELRSQYAPALDTNPVIRDYKFASRFRKLPIEVWFLKSIEDLAAHNIAVNISGVGIHDDFKRIIPFDGINFTASMIHQGNNKADLYLCFLGSPLIHHYDLGVIKKDFSSVIPTILRMISEPQNQA